MNYEEIFEVAEWPSSILRHMQELGTLPKELADLIGIPQDPTHHPEGDAWVHTLLVMDAMSRILSREGIIGERRVTLMFAAMLHDVGKATTTQWHPEKQKWTSYGHAEAGVPIARGFLERFAPNFGQKDEVLALVLCHMYRCHKEFTSKAVRKLANKLQPSNISDLVLVMEADGMGRGPASSGLPRSVLEDLIPLARENMVYLSKREKNANRGQYIASEQKRTEGSCNQNF